MNETFTRKQYLNNEVTHEQYYGQFVNQPLRDLVTLTFGYEKLVKAFATDKHFNNIPLRQWGMLSMILDNKTFRQRLKDVGDFYSDAGAVCTLKEAARQVATAEKEEVQA